MTYLMCLFLGFAAGHYVSPWLDERTVDFLKWLDPDDHEDEWMLK